MSCEVRSTSLIFVLFKVVVEPFSIPFSQVKEEVFLQLNSSVDVNQFEVYLFRLLH